MISWIFGISIWISFFLLFSFCSSSTSHSRAQNQII